MSSLRMVRQSGRQVDHRRLDSSLHRKLARLQEEKGDEVNAEKCSGKIGYNHFILHCTLVVVVWWFGWCSITAGFGC